MTAMNLVNPDEPKPFEEKWYHPNPVQWEHWQKAIRKEFSSMINLMCGDVFKKISPTINN